MLHRGLCRLRREQITFFSFPTSALIFFFVFLRLFPSFPLSPSFLHLPSYFPHSLPLLPLLLLLTPFPCFSHPLGISPGNNLRETRSVTARTMAFKSQSRYDCQTVRIEACGMWDARFQPRRLQMKVQEVMHICECG